MFEISLANAVIMSVHKIQFSILLWNTSKFWSLSRHLEALCRCVKESQNDPVAVPPRELIGVLSWEVHTHVLGDARDRFKKGREAKTKGLIGKAGAGTQVVSDRDVLQEGYRHNGTNLTLGFEPVKCTVYSVPVATTGKKVCVMK